MLFVIVTFVDLGCPPLLLFAQMLYNENIPFSIPFCHKAKLKGFILGRELDVTGIEVMFDVALWSMRR